MINFAGIHWHVHSLAIGNDTIKARFKLKSIKANVQKTGNPKLSPNYASNIITPSGTMYYSVCIMGLDA